MRDTRQLTRRLVVVLGLGLLAVTPALSLLAQAGHGRCAWTCYAPAHSPASHERVVDSLTLWHVRPTLAVAMLLVAVIAWVSLHTSRRQLLAAGGVALAGGLAVIDAIGSSGVGWLRVPPHSLYLVQPSPLLIVPIAGVALTLDALVTSRFPPAGGAYPGGGGETKSRR